MSDGLKRVITALIGAPLVLLIVWFPWTFPFKILIWLTAILAATEFYKMVIPSEDEKNQRIFGLILGGLYGFLILFSSPSGFIMLPAVMAVIVAFVYMILKIDSSPDPVHQVASKVGLFLLGTFYLVGFTIFIAFLRDLDHGVFWVSLLFIGTWLNDTFAMVFGKLFGKHKLAPRVSPGKTVEGVLGGLIGSAVAIFVVQHLFDYPIALLHSLILVFMISILGPVGDLSESVVKRSCNVKDSGNLIPGHGGVWDRIDALIFNAPFVFYLASYIQ